MVSIRRKWVQYLLWLALISGLWQALSLSGLFPRLLLPGLPEIFRALFRSIGSGQLLGQTGFSVLVIVIGLAGGAVLSLLLLMAGTVSKVCASFSDFLVTFLHPLPGIALLPLVVLWFGTGTAAVLVVIVHSVVWPMFTNILAGYRSLPEQWRLVADNYRMDPWSRLVHVVIPGILPSVYAGLRIGWARAWRALISAEMVFGAIGKTGGLGWYIFNRRVFMDTPGLFGGLVVVVIIGLLAENLLFLRLEARTVKRWETG